LKRLYHTDVPPAYLHRQHLKQRIETAEKRPANPTAAEVGISNRELKRPRFCAVSKR